MTFLFVSMRAEYRFDPHESRPDRDRLLSHSPQSESLGAKGLLEKERTLDSQALGKFVQSSTVVGRHHDSSESRDAVRGEQIVHHSRNGILTVVHRRDQSRRETGIGYRTVGVVCILVRGGLAAQVHQQNMRHKGNSP